MLFALMIFAIRYSKIENMFSCASSCPETAPSSVMTFSASGLSLFTITFSNFVRMASKADRTVVLVVDCMLSIPAILPKG